MNFKPSKYNVSFYDKGKLVLVNLLTKAIAEVENKNEEIVKEIIKNPDKSFKLKYPELFENLKYGGYIVPSEFDEIQHLKILNSIERFDRSVANVTIMPTMQCNFDCIYCYEKKEGPVMGPSTVDTVIMFLKKMVRDKKIVNLGWFGGEPLVAFDLIRYINSTISKYASSQNTKFNSFITTNGYLLTEEKINEVEKLNIRSFQITLDGPPEYHNRYRYLKGGGSTFDRIYSNLKLLFGNTEHTTVKIRVNVGPDNYNSIDKLLDLLSPFPKDRFLVYFRWIFQGSATNFSFHNEVRAFQGTPKEKFIKLSNLYYKAIERGFDVMLPILSGNFYCEYDRINSVLIGPEGNLYLCTVAVNKDEKSGRITPDGPVYNSMLFDKWHSFSAFNDEQCLKCPLLPLCMGGCRNARMKGISRGCPEELGYIEEFTRLWYRVEKAKRRAKV